MDCIEVTVQLYELLQRLEVDQQARIESIDQSIARHTTMLEFCVDTQDPNAHKHQAVLDELEFSREQLVEDIANHSKMEGDLPGKASGIVRQLSRHPHGNVEKQRLARLRESCPIFFDESLLHAAMSPSKTVPPPPRSLFVVPRAHTARFRRSFPSNNLSPTFGRGGLAAVSDVTVTDHPKNSKHNATTAIKRPESAPPRSDCSPKASTSTQFRAEIEQFRKQQEGQLPPVRLLASRYTPTKSPLPIRSPSQVAVVGKSELSQIAEDISDIHSPPPGSITKQLSYADDANQQLFDTMISPDRGLVSTITSPTGFVLKQGRRHKVNKGVLVQSASPTQYDSTEFFIAKYPV
jgi:hypothetical protein